MKYCPVLNCKVLYNACEECTIEERKECNKISMKKQHWADKQPKLDSTETYTEIVNIEPKEEPTKKKYKKAVIGIDQSYTNTGISIAVDGEIKKITSTKYYKQCPVRIKDDIKINGKGKLIKTGKPSKSDKRKYVKDIIKRAIELCQSKADETIVIIERMRTYNQGHDNYARYIKATAGLIATIVDVAAEYNVKVYSVDTKAWKRAIVGKTERRSNIMGIPAEKFHTVYYVAHTLGFRASITYYTEHGKRLKWDDDAADSACIALYGFLPVEKQKLMLEE